MLGLWFFLEGLNAAFCIGHHNAIAADVGQGHIQRHHAGQGAFGLVLRQGGGDVQVNQGIAAQHQGGFVKEAAEVLDAAHTAGRSHGAGQNVAVFAHALVGVANLHAPAATVAKIFFNLVVVVSHVDHDFGDAVAGQVLNQVFHHRFAQNRHHRFGQVPCEWAHAGALAGGQNHAFSHAGLH